MAASLCGVAQADLLGVGGGVAGGLGSRIDARTIGGFGDQVGVDAYGRAATQATGNIPTTRVEQMRSEAGGRVTGTAQSAVHTGQELGAQVESQSRAAVGYADNSARQAAADAVVVAGGAYASSTAAASNVGAVASNSANSATAIAADSARNGANGAASGNVVASSGEGLDGALRGDAAASAGVHSEVGAVNGSFESSAAGAVSTN
jgi:hypothetical protein